MARKIEVAFKGNLLKPFEVIWVDDGSTDKTAKQIRRVCNKLSHHHGIYLMRNAGQSAALMAGVDKSNGKYIATMDGDVQNDPDTLPKMYKKLRKENLDMVVGWRVERWKDEGSRRILSKMANAILRKSFKSIDIHDAGCPVKIAKRKVFKRLKLYGELHRFITYMAGDMGARIGEAKIHHRERMYGVSKYGFMRIFKVMMDIVALKFLTMSKTTPLQFMGPLIFILFGAGLVSMTITIYLKIFAELDMTNSAIGLLSAILFITATQFLIMGLLGELIVRAYFEGSGKKNYYVR